MRFGRRKGTGWAALSTRGRRRTSRGPIRFEGLEVRLLLSVTPVISEYPAPGEGQFPNSIVAGPDGNLWFTEPTANEIGKFNPATPNAITVYEVPTPSAFPGFITLGSDGDLWFTENLKIGSITPTGTINEYPLPAGVTNPAGITTGPDGSLWFTTPGLIVKMNISSHAFTEYPDTATGATPGSIVTGPDGNLWFTDATTGKIGMVNLKASPVTVTEFSVLTADAAPTGIAAGADGQLWFTEKNNNAIGSIDPVTHAVTETKIPTASSHPSGIVAGPDGGLWFTETTTARIGEINPTTRAISDYAAPVASSPTNITVGPDRNLWFTDETNNSLGVAAITGTVSGQVFADANDNGLIDPGVSGGNPAETGVAYQLVFEDLHNDGVFHSDDPSAVTDANGNFTIAGTLAGTYNLCVAFPGNETTGPPPGGSYPITLAVGQTLSGQNVGVEQVSTLLPLYPNAAPFGTNTDVVAAEITGFYRLVLNRAPEAGAVAYYENHFQSGQHLNEIAKSFFHAPEYLTDVINEEYASYLGRGPSSAEQPFNLSHMEAGTTTSESLAVSLLSSQEETNLDPDNADFTQTVYHDILGRQATVAEQSYYVKELNAGTVRASMVYAVTHSPEAETRVVDSVYSDFFARLPVPSELSYYEAELKAGTSVIDVAPGFLVGVEYTNRAQQSVSS